MQVIVLNVPAKLRLYGFVVRHKIHSARLVCPLPKAKAENR